MPFIENGRMVERRSVMRAGTIADIFWGLLNTIYAFFHCMFSVCPNPPKGTRQANPVARQQAPPHDARWLRAYPACLSPRICAYAALRCPAVRQRPCWLRRTLRRLQTRADDPAAFWCASRGPAARGRPQPLLRPATCGLGGTAVPVELTSVPVQPAAAEDVQAGKYEGPFGSGGPGSGGPWGGGGGGRGGRRGPNIAGVRRYDAMDAPPMGGGG